MFAIVSLLFWAGLGSEGEAAEDIHEILAYALLSLIVAHIAGLAIHTLRHRENTSLSMVTEVKQSPPENSLRSSLPLLKSTIQLGEEEEHHQGHETDSGDESEDDDD